MRLRPAHYRLCDAAFVRHRVPARGALALPGHSGTVDHRLCGGRNDPGSSAERRSAAEAVHAGKAGGGNGPKLWRGSTRLLIFIGFSAKRIDDAMKRATVGFAAQF